MLNQRQASRSIGIHRSQESIIQGFFCFGIEVPFEGGAVEEELAQCRGELGVVDELEQDALTVEKVDSEVYHLREVCCELALGLTQQGE